MDNSCLRSVPKLLKSAINPGGSGLDQLPPLALAHAVMPTNSHGGSFRSVIHPDHIAHLLIADI